MCVRVQATEVEGMITAANSANFSLATRTVLHSLSQQQKMIKLQIDSIHIYRGVRCMYMSS